MAEQKFFKEQSKREWFTTQPVTNDDIQTGCLMRIADATELMAKNYVQMQNEMNNYKRWFKEEQEISQHLRKSNAALRGVINKMKKR